MAIGASKDPGHLLLIFIPVKDPALLVSRKGVNASNVHVLVASDKGKVQNVHTEGLQIALDLLPPVSMDREI